MYYRRGLDLPMACHRADAKLVSAFADIRQLPDPVDIDQNLEPAQPEVQDGNEALPTRQNSGLVPVLLQKRQGVVRRVWESIQERGRLHILELEEMKVWQSTKHRNATLYRTIPPPSRDSRRHCAAPGPPPSSVTSTN